MSSASSIPDMHESATRINVDGGGDDEVYELYDAEEREAGAVPEHIALNYDMSTLGSYCSMCDNKAPMCRELIDSLHQYSEALGDLAKWGSGKYDRCHITLHV
jgi:hypothetical protein